VPAAAQESFKHISFMQPPPTRMKDTLFVIM